MDKTRTSLFYLGGYLSVIGFGLLLVVNETLRILRSNRDYGDVFPRIAGMLITGLGLSVLGMIRARTAQLYPATLFIRVYFMVCIVVFYEATTLFLVLIATVGLGFALSLTAHLVDRNTLATASSGPSTKPAQR